MSGCCGTCSTFDGSSRQYRRVLWLVIALNAGMFGVEMLAGWAASSQALKADALDFLGDTVSYGLALAVIGRAARLRAGVALAKGASLGLMALLVLGGTLWRCLVLGQPDAGVMGWVGLAALAANLASAGLLWRYAEGDANVRSVWLCSRNDAIGNVAVLGAAGLVSLTGSPWPDLVTAGLMALLFLSSSISILRQSLAELRPAEAAG
jgi:Co/Zn/Cd efflux system component